MEYLYIVAISLLLSFIIERYNSRIALLVLSLFLSSICGLRGPEVGIDTENYIRYLNDIQLRGVGYGSEWGFSLISYYLMYFFQLPYIPLFIYSLITNFLIIYRIWEFKDKASFPLMILIFLAFYYPYTFIIVRQMLAISLIFWGSRYIEKGKLSRYLLYNVIAITFHTSSIICLVLAFIAYLKRAKKQFRLAIGVCCFFLLIICLIALETRLYKYQQYEGTQEFTFQIMTIVELLVYFYVAFLSGNIYKPSFCISKSKRWFGISKQISKTYGLGIILYACGMFMTFTNRIGLYFLMFGIPFWGQLSCARYHKRKYNILILMLIFIKLFSIIMSENRITANYYTFLNLL